jgi:glycosyltransferase involved in cell wall biosynthesis
VRILTLSYEFPPVGGGGSGVVKGLGAELVKMGHTVDVVTMAFGGLPNREEVAGINVHRVECGRRSESKCTPMEAFKYLSQAQGKVEDLLDQNDYDFVHVHFIFPDGIVALRTVAKRGIPYVITAHGSDVPGYNQKVFFKFAYPFLLPSWRKVTSHSAGIVSPSETLAKLIEQSKPGAPVHLIPNGFDPDRLAPCRKSESILVATRLVERKGVQYLLKALDKCGTSFERIVVGSGEYQDELLALNERLGRPARFVGWMNNDAPEFKKLLEESAIYVLPSDFENFPVCLLEAMAAGSAIITTSGHGCEEVVGDCAEFVTPGNRDESACIRELAESIDRLSTDRAYREDLGARARRRLDENFTWPAVARRYESLFKQQVATG